MARSRRTTQCGFTLMEVILAITLVAAISAGMLTAMRSGLLTLNRTQQRLDENRVALGIQDLLRRQIGGMMPVKGLCKAGEGEATVPIFRGDAERMLMVSSVSMTEGARGYPRILLYQVQPNPDGTVRLVVYERLFSGPASTLQACDPVSTIIPPAPVDSPAFVVFDHLAYCRFSYRNLNFNTLQGLDWMEGWAFPYLPYAVRIDIAAAPGTASRMPVGAITIPLHVSRGPEERYADQQ
ncbi:MAG: prepilin-type N-terminal cleavage/methylation domain-containing protein [Acidobacteriota bacterium]